MSKTAKESIEAKLKQLPACPGCYLFKDAEGAVLYVGKALALKNRVRSYFQSSTRHSNRIARMVSRVRDLEWIVVESELEALVLECNLIKRHRPPYNVRLRDDKSYPFITITHEKFPRVLFTRKLRKDGAKYFGPYTSAYTVRETLQTLHKLFPLIPCGKSWSGREEQRPCLYYHMKQCLAPCAGLANPKEYAEVVQQVALFLSGKGDALIKRLRAQMEDAAEALEFEKAAALRDKLAAIESVLQRQSVLTSEPIDRDVIAVVKDDRGSAIQMLYVRGGKLIGQRQFLLDGSGDVPPNEVVQEFVKQYYATAPEVPREVLLPVEIEERKIVQQWLRNRKGGTVSIEVPQGGDRLRLVDLAAQNAQQALVAASQAAALKEAWFEEAQSQLQDALELPGPPFRIEGYDISNVQGALPVGSMVVMEGGEPAKGEYRRFRIRYNPETPNDFAMMKEVLLRRFRAYAEGDPKFGKLPDLIVVDGGRGQLGAAMEARDEVGVTVPMVGLAKQLELLVVPLEERPSKESGPRYRDVELPLQSPGLVLVRRLRDEAHRFAQSFHRKLRDKNISRSALEEVPGVGPRRKRLLLRTFGSLEAIRRASAEEIAAVPTMTHRIALAIKDHLKEA